MIKGVRFKGIIGRAVAASVAAVLVLSSSISVWADTSEWGIFNGSLNVELPDYMDIFEYPTSNDEMQEILDTDGFSEIAFTSSDDGETIMFYVRQDHESANRDTYEINSEADVRNAFDAFGASEIKQFYKDTDRSKVKSVEIDKVISGNMYFAKVEVKTEDEPEELYWTCYNNMSMIAMYSMMPSIMDKSDHKMMDQVVESIDATSLLSDLSMNEFNIEDYDEDFDDDGDSNITMIVAFIGMLLAFVMPLITRGGDKDKLRKVKIPKPSKSSTLKGLSWLLDEEDDAPGSAGNHSANDKANKQQKQQKQAPYKAEGVILEEHKDCFAGDDKPADKPKSRLFRDSKPEHVKAGESKRDSLWAAEKEEYHSIAGNYEENLKTLVRSGMLTKQQMEEMLEKRRRKGGR